MRCIAIFGFLAAGLLGTADAAAQQRAAAPAQQPEPGEPPPAQTPPAAPATQEPPPVAPPVPGESHVKPAPPKPPVERRITTPVIAAGSVAGAALASGIVFAIVASSKNSSYKSEPNHDVALDGEQAAFIADVSFGLSALFGFTAIALYFLPDEPTPAPGKAALAVPTRASSWARSALTGELFKF